MVVKVGWLKNKRKEKKKKKLTSYYFMNSPHKNNNNNIKIKRYVIKSESKVLSSVKNLMKIKYLIKIKIRSPDCGKCVKSEVSNDKYLYTVFVTLIY